LHAPKDTLDGATWAPSTQRHYRKIAIGLWHFAMDREHEAAEVQSTAVTITRNPWKSARIPKPPRVRPAVLTPEEIRDVIWHEETIGTPKAAFLGCAAFAGLRQQEIAN